MFAPVESVESVLGICFLGDVVVPVRSCGPQAATRRSSTSNFVFMMAPGREGVRRYQSSARASDPIERARRVRRSPCRGGLNLKLKAAVHAPTLHGGRPRSRP